MGSNRCSTSGIGSSSVYVNVDESTLMIDARCEIHRIGEEVANGVAETHIKVEETG